MKRDIPVQVGGIHRPRGDNEAAGLQYDRESGAIIDCFAISVRGGVSVGVRPILVIMEDSMRPERKGRNHRVIQWTVFVGLWRRFRREWAANRGLRMYHDSLARKVL